MKREKGMSTGGRILTRIAFVCLMTIAVLLGFAFVVFGEWGIYNESRSRVEEEQVEALARNCAKNVLRPYLYHDTDTAHEEAAGLYPETNINFMIYYDGKPIDEIVNVENMEVRNGIRYEENFLAEEIMSYDELWEQVWVTADVISPETEALYGEWDTEGIVYEWETEAGGYEWRNLVNSMGNETIKYGIAYQIADIPAYSDDIFIKAQAMVDWAYDARNQIIGWFFASLLASLILFGILMKKAGYVKGEEELRVSWLERMPFDILTACYLAIVSLVIMILMEFIPKYSYVIGNLRATDYTFVYFIILGVGVGAAFMAFLTMLFFESVSVRVKAGRWWKNTVMYRLMIRLKKMIKKGICAAGDFIAQKLPFVWKIILILLALSLVEFIIIAWAFQGYQPNMLLLFWAFEKLALLVLLVSAILQMKKLKEGGESLAAGNLEQKVDTNRMFWDFKKHGENLNHIGVGIQHAVEERMKSERFRTELITNVSHDIKTPLTSIINYVDLLEKEDLQNPHAEEYLEVLHRQSARLKKLIEDLMEASKASTGALSVNLEDCEVGVMLTQAAGEFEEKLKSRELTLLISKPEEELVIRADGRHLWRVFDNLLNNIYKYAQPGTRVYLNLEKKERQLEIIFRNTSKCALNISGEELKERFVRGDSSRNTEGSGLGLSIATSLTELMGGRFELVIDGDLFKVILTFPIYGNQEL